MDNSNLFKSVIASLTRHVLTGVAGYLTARGLITPEQSEGLILAAVSGIIALVWALWNKYAVGVKIQTALKMPAGSTSQQLDDAVAEGK